VVGGDHQQGVVLAGQLLGGGDGLGELDGLVQGHPRLVDVVGLVDATALDEEEVALLALAHVLDGLAGHLLQSGLA